MVDHTDKIGQKVCFKDYQYTHTMVYSQEHVFRKGFTEVMVKDEDGKLETNQKLVINESYDVYGTLNISCEVFNTITTTAVGNTHNITGDKIITTTTAPAGYTII